MRNWLVGAICAAVISCGPKAPPVVRPSIAVCPENARIEEMHVADTDEPEVILHCILICFHPDETLPVTYWRVHIVSHIFVPASDADTFHGAKGHQRKSTKP